MAVVRNGVYFTAFTYVEKNEVFNRRIHELVVHDCYGNVHRLVGKNLPAAIFAYLGESHKGHHVAEILLPPGQRLALTKERSRWSSVRRWPTPRDVVHMLLGFVAIALINFLLAVVKATM